MWNRTWNGTYPLYCPNIPSLLPGLCTVQTLHVIEAENQCLLLFWIIVLTQIIIIPNLWPVRCTADFINIVNLPLLVRSWFCIVYSRLLQDSTEMHCVFSSSMQQRLLYNSNFLSRLLLLRHPVILCPSSRRLYYFSLKPQWQSTKHQATIMFPSAEKVVMKINEPNTRKGKSEFCSS